MTPPFHSPRSFDPSYSLLGRAFWAWTGDRLQGKALHLVALTGLALALIMSHYLSWALLRPFFAAQPSWQTMLWIVQALSGLTLGVVGLIGFRPGVTVSYTATALRLKQGGRLHVVTYDDIDQVDTVSATTFYRHYRRYATTTLFVSRLPETVLLLRTPEGPVVVALPDADERAALRHHLTTVGRDTPDPVPQP